MRDRGQREAEKIAPRVAHEDPRRRAIVPQKSHERTDEHQQKPGHEQMRLTRLRIGDQQHHGGQHPRRDRADAGRKAVHIVEHVERIHQPDDPQQA